MAWVPDLIKSAIRSSNDITIASATDGFYESLFSPMLDFFDAKPVHKRPLSKDVSSLSVYTEMICA